MEMQTLGKTGLRVSRLGVGLSEIGHQLTLADEAQAARILNTALDAGLNFLDTAACYGVSEELIGRAVGHRREEYVLATKAGHATAGYPGQDWTAETIRDSIERSLRRLRTDYLDLVQLHSCGVAVLEQGEVIRALEDAREAGKARFIGYSGDNRAAEWAVGSGRFDTLQTSFNLVDQRARTALFPEAEDRNMGIIAKRPIANAVWGETRSPSAYAYEYFRRAQSMAEPGPLPAAPENDVLLALGFVLAHAAVDTAIVGTSDPEHMQANIDWVNRRLPIARQTVEELHRRFDQLGQAWTQQG